MLAKKKNLLYLLVNICIHVLFLVGTNKHIIFLHLFTESKGKYL